MSRQTVLGLESASLTCWRCFWEVDSTVGIEMFVNDVRKLTYTQIVQFVNLPHLTPLLLRL
jgi:hypothetical protein